MLDFAPTGAVLAAAIDELDELGARGGGAVDTKVREAALQAFLTARRRALPKQWRHDYSALDFAGLDKPQKVWQFQRVRAHGMWTYEPREGRKAATAVCSASAVVTLTFFIYDGRVWIYDGIGNRLSSK